MANYLTIDGGTTNTRINLFINGEFVNGVSLGIGVKANIDGNKTYKNKIKQGIEELLLDNSCEVEKIICSGMITSDLGLCPLDHIPVPCGIEELSNNLYETEIPEISNIPFVFVRGVKTECDTLEKADMMRGEETEFIGIAESDSKDCLCILPGSHSKIISIDSDGKISDFTTELTGELIDAVANNTIVKDAVSFENSELDTEYLQKGYLYAKEKGVNAAFFKVRVLKNMFKAHSSQVYSFFMGVALCDEIEGVINSPLNKVYIGGKPQLRIPTEFLLKKNSNKEIIGLCDEKSKFAASVGMIKIYKYSKK